jgi:hypothetical protein
MTNKKLLIPFLLASILFTFACAYIVLPEDLDSPTSTVSKGWSAEATNISKSDTGALHIDLVIRNETGDWSAMKAAEGKPAVLTTGNGKTTDCETVFVGTGGHRLAPGFQMRAYTGGTKVKSVTQPIYVECTGVEASPGSKLSINYSYFTGQYNYYEQDKTRVDEKLTVNLDEIVADLSYPVAESIDGLIQKTDNEITGLNKVVLTLTDIQRTDHGLQFTWQTFNPGEYPSYVHIGNPPVIGTDGVLYGYYETPDLASVPLTPAGDKAEWTTEVAVPQDVKGFYILLSVESGKARLFANYALDITDK